MKLIFKLAVILFALLPTAVFAQFPNSAPGGPVAVGQAQAQKDDAGKVAIVMAPPVEAASKGGGIIQLSALGWLEPYADSLVQALIAAGFAWFAKSKYSTMMDESSRAALEAFAKNRASSLLADGAVKLSGKSIDVHSAMLAQAAAESSTAIPDAMKRFGLTPDVVAQKIIDAIPQTAAGAAIIAQAHAVDPAAPVDPVQRTAPAAPGMPPVAGVVA